MAPTDQELACGRLPEPVVGDGQFAVAAIGLEHGHIYGMCGGLSKAGAEVRWVCDSDPAKVRAFQESFPHARAARCMEEILDDDAVKLIAAAPVPCDRCDLGLAVLDRGKDYFVDKAPMTTLDQLARARAKAAETGGKYMVYYGERLHSEGSIFAGRLIRQGAIGGVVQVMSLAPHRLNAAGRPAWFFQKDKCGGILCDIGSHQIEQFLHFAGAADAEVLHARVENLAHPEHPEFEDFGEATLRAPDGAGHYARVDWFTPEGLSTWGDVRLFVLGTAGSIEVRKCLDVARSPEGDQVFLVDGERERHFAVSGRVGFPFFGELLLDCLHRTEDAMTQAHAFKAAELCLQAQALADRERRRSP